MWNAGGSARRLCLGAPPSGCRRSRSRPLLTCFASSRTSSPATTTIATSVTTRTRCSSATAAFMLPTASSFVERTTSSRHSYPDSVVIAAPVLSSLRRGLGPSILNGRLVSHPPHDRRPYSSSTTSETNDNNSHNRRLFVSNLAYSVSDADLRLHMESVGGHVVGAHLFTDLDGGSKGSAVVEFATPAQANHALQTLPSTTLQGRRIHLRYDQKPPQQAQSSTTGSSQPQQQDCKVYIDNVPDSVRWQELKDWARSALLLPSDGDNSVVRSANVWVDAETGQRRLGVVVLDRPESVDDLLLATSSTMMRRTTATTTTVDDDPFLLMGRAVTVRRASDVPEEAGLVLLDEVWEAKTSNQSSTAAVPPPASMVHVGNLPPSTTWPQLKDHMRRAGAVRSANVYYDTTTDAEEERLFGLVLYHDTQDAFRAIESLDGSNRIQNYDDDDHNQFGNISVRPATQSDVKHKGSPIETTAATVPWGESCSVYVTNLGGSVRWQELKDHMRLAGGAVRSANVYHDGGEMYGVVLFANPDDAATAIKRLNGSELEGLPVQLYTAREYSQQQQQQNISNSNQQRLLRNSNDPCKVYVSNLSEYTTWQHLKDHMRSAGGNVRSANVDGKGHGVVIYKSPGDAARAVRSLNHSSLLAQPIVVRSSRDVDTEDADIDESGMQEIPKQSVTYDDYDFAVNVTSRSNQQQRQRNDHPDSTPGTVYVTNLPPRTRWQDVKDFLRQAGSSVSSVNVYPNNSSDSDSSYGVAKFPNPQDAERAISMLNGKPLSGRRDDVIVQVSDRLVVPSEQSRAGSS